MLGPFPILEPLFILLLRLLDVSLGTLRIMLVFRGRRWYAGLVGFVEVTIFVVALGTVLANLDNIWNIMGYSLGFAGGTILGSFIEEKMALGFMTVQIIPYCDELQLSTALRERGFGVTSFEAWGRDGRKVVLMTHLFRKDWKKLQDLIEEMDAQAFITVMDTRSARGGYLRHLRKVK